jgi:hypothetical protein
MVLEVGKEGYAMLTAVWAIVRNGKIELTENVSLAVGERVLVTLLDSKDEGSFWERASQDSLADVWDNPEDDVYVQLLNARPSDLLFKV